jgi:predicted Zn-dependent protease
VPNATRASLRRPVLLLLTLALALPVGCARNPVSGWPELVLVSTAREVEIGREEAAKVEKSIGYVPDRALQLWVQEIGKRLAVHSPRQDVEYHFYVVDMVEPNAFALPGGHVYVSRGLLALVNSEDELACVLGHEIGHVAARHAVQRATLATPFALVLGIPTAIVGSVSDVLGDVVGGGGSRRPSFFDSHPSTPSRVRDTAEFAETLEVAPRDAIAADRPALLARLDGLLVGANPEQGVFEDELFMHPVLGFGIRFPAGWQTANTQSYVAASDPDDSKVLVVLQLAAEGSDPLAGAEADGLEEAAAERLEKVRIEDLEAVRFEGERRGSGFDLTWIAHRGHVYRVIASAPTAEFRRRRVMLQGVANSFHSLAEAERKRILEDRLRVARARSGESLAALVERTGSSWSAEKVAVANGRRVEEPLEAGELLKVPLLQRFRAS